MAKWAFITDTHAGVRNDSPLFMEIQARFYREVFWPTLAEEGVTRIMHLGDYFDKRRMINFASLKSNYESFLIPSREYDCHLVVGNHDTFYRNTNDLNSPGLLIQEPNWNIYHANRLVELDGVKVAMVPWITPENKAPTLKWLRETDCDIVLGHFEFAGFEMRKGQVSDHGLEYDAVETCPQVYSGHFHTPSERGNIKYLGSPFYLTWGDYGDLRGFHLFDTETLETTFHKNPHEVFVKIYYDGSQKASDYDTHDKYVKMVVTSDNVAETEAFIAEIRAQEPYELQVIDDGIADDISKANVDVGDAAIHTKSIIQEYVDDTDLDGEIKTTVNKMLTEVYHEAMEE